MLLLDEPTNHLDLDMREALAEALSDFRRRDRAGLARSPSASAWSATRFWRVADGVVQPFDGDLDEYARLAAHARQRLTPNRRHLPKPRRLQPIAATKKKPPNPHKLAEAEARVAELESKLHAIDMDLADPDVYSDGGTNAAELSRKRDALTAELVTAEADLLSLYEAA